MLVLADPPGVAKVYDGQRFIGIAPNYMRFRRGRNPVLRMEMPDGEIRQVPLKTKYRWGDSFGMNWLLTFFAPAGWLFDIATGTAWDAQDPPLQVFGKGGEWPGVRNPGRVAVAPPQGVDFETANALGLAIDEKLRATEKYSVMDFEESATSFQFYRSYSGLALDRDNRYRLLSDLKVDHILVSTAEKQGDTFVVTGEMKDVITTKTKARYTWEISAGNRALREEFTAKSFFNRYFYLMPNTVFLNFAGYTPTVTINGHDYQGKEAEARGFGEKMGQYLSALSLAGLERQRFNTIGHFTFNFVPTAIVSQKRIVLPTYGPLTDTEFRRSYLSAGYGFEGGYMGRFGLVYLDLIPMLTWSRVSYTSPDGHGAIDRFSVQSMAELGYSYFITNHLIARLFFRTVTEDETAWNRAFRKAEKTPLSVNDVSSGFAGVSVGYYIPTAAERRTGWLVRRR